MIITIKQLQGGEVSIEVSSTTKIISIKRLIAKKLRIPIAEQKILLAGRALSDNLTVASYPTIINGTKLNLIVKKPDGLLEVAAKYFKSKGMTEAEAQSKANLLLKIVEEKFYKMSWDDVERLAMDCMRGQRSKFLQTVHEVDNEAECEDSLGLF